MSILNSLSMEQESGFLIIDQSWQIVDLSTTVHRFSDEPSAVSRGQDVRLGFPELFGLEDCLDQLLQAAQESFKLKGVDRSLNPFNPLYIDICLFKNHEYDSHRSTFIILIEDATERMVLQQALVQSANETSLLLQTLMASKAYIDQVVSSMVDALLVTTRSGQIKTANSAAQLLLEYSESELIQQSIATLFIDSEIPTSETTIKLSKQHIETICQTKTGRQIPVECSISIVQTEVEDFQGFVYTLRDITERQQADQIKREFLAMVSHEIRTPINAVLGMTNLLANTNLDIQQTSFVEMIRTSGDTLLTIINDLLDLSKIESGKLELEDRGFNLRACVQGTLNLLAPKAAEKGLELAFLDRLNLPTRISGDETRLRQILSNLLSNAIKFTEAGEIVVSVSAHPTDSELEPALYRIQFSVRDTGIGIPADRLDRLFKSFSQVDSSITRQYGGTGLGLAICKKLSELMGGQIWVESQPNQGSTFYFTILAPLLPDRSDSGIISQAPNWIDSSLAQRYPLRILLAEDNKINQKIIRLICEQMGYQVNLVTNGLEVLDALQQQPYDLILMDVQMPEMDGITATQRICRDWAPRIRPRIIAMTASAMRGDRQACLEAGMDDYLPKPIQIHELTQALIRSYELRIQGQKQWAEAQRAEEPQVEAQLKLEKPQGSLALFPAVSQLATIDPIALQSLQRMVPTNPRRFLAETIEDYLEGAPDLVQAIRTSLDQGDLKTLRRSAHTLCSSSATLGATELSSLCQDLESLAASGRLNAATGQLTRIELEYQRVQSALQQEREKCLDAQ